MSAFDGEDSRREIIIVKRRNNDLEDGHHGGMWKIAFADFMTAMMCFFLVMWLVNASNEETKAAIASYFNPMTLVDAAPSQKGLSDPGEETNPEANREPDAQLDPHTQDVIENNRSGPGQQESSTNQSDRLEPSDRHLFSDPYAVLAEIAQQTAMLQNISTEGDGGAQTSGPATGAQGGESYRDPFAPDFWSQEIAQSDDPELDVFRERSVSTADEIREAEAAVEAEIATLAEQALPGVGEPAPDAPDAAAEAETMSSVSEQAPTEPESVDQAVAPQTARLAEQIRDEILEAFGRNSELNKTISVTARAEGVLISVTDELNYGMFEVGSAVPRGELVRAMERIGQTLSEHAGRIRINGHTDGRPFRNENYDNWRLSTARAHAAYYMLVRGGMEENRIREVAGFADRELKIADDPLADANRRIEIFLEAGG
ncbi:MotB family protein [Mesorhizobium sp. CAU 1732]|uniref:MotB family protein n=1 Tax=Mesorhizobium sp. CAU 1732 TaxID=3140358 RepID=UPI0032612716